MTRPATRAFVYVHHLRTWSCLSHRNFKPLCSYERSDPTEEAGKGCLDGGQSYEKGKAFSNYEQLHKALGLVFKMFENGISPPLENFASLLQGCSEYKALWEGRQVHTHLINNGLEANVLLGNLLISMYIKCESPGDAYRWFGKMFAKDVFTWTLVITAYAKSDDCEQAMGLFWRMKDEGVRPNKVTFLSVIRACTCLREVKTLFAYVVEEESCLDDFVISTLLDLYAKHAALDDAFSLFKRVQKSGVAPWNAMIAGFSQQELHHEAFALFGQMLLEVVKPDEVTYVTLLKSCSSRVFLEDGQKVHAFSVENGMESNSVVVNTIVNMYAKCMSIENAQHTFDKMSNRDIVSWSVIITEYTQHGHVEKALLFFDQMLLSGIKPNKVVYMCALKACGILQSMRRGQRIHSGIALYQLELDPFIGSALVDMYSKCGSIEDAHSVFVSIVQQDTVMWNSLIDGYTEAGHDREALRLFQHMIYDGFRPDEGTIVSSLKACVDLADLEQGRQVHGYAVENSMHSHSQIGNCLIGLYAKIGSIACAHQVFNKLPRRDVVSYNTIISTCVQNELCYEAMNIFCQMLAENVKADSITFGCMIKACASLASLERGMQVHALTIKGGHDKEDVVRGILVDMYAKCGCIAHVKKLFGCIYERDTMSWTAMVSGYAQHGLVRDVLRLLEKMHNGCVEVDEITFIGVLSACSYGGLVDEGVCCFYTMHHICKLTPSSQHYACVVDLLGRAGRLHDALDLLRRIPCHPAAVMWTALLAACKLHGELEIAVNAVQGVLGLEPPNITASVLLSNCNAVVFFQEEEGEDETCT